MALQCRPIAKLNLIYRQITTFYEKLQDGLHEITDHHKGREQNKLCTIIVRQLAKSEFYNCPCLKFYMYQSSQTEQMIKPIRGNYSICRHTKNVVFTYIMQVHVNVTPNILDQNTDSVTSHVFLIKFCPNYVFRNSTKMNKRAGWDY